MSTKYLSMIPAVLDYLANECKEMTTDDSLPETIQRSAMDLQVSLLKLELDIRKSVTQLEKTYVVRTYHLPEPIPPQPLQK